VIHKHHISLLIEQSQYLIRCYKIPNAYFIKDKFALHPVPKFKRGSENELGNSCITIQACVTPSEKTGKPCVEVIMICLSPLPWLISLLEGFWWKLISRTQKTGP